MTAQKSSDSSSDPSSVPHEIRIERKDGIRWLDWREFVEYRDLLWTLVRRDFVARYKQTILGPVWFLFQPLVTILVFGVVFGSVVKIPTDGVPPPLFYMAGLLGWNFFLSIFQTTSVTLTSNAQLFGKVYFPRLIVPLAAVFGNLLNYFLQLLLFGALFLYYKVRLGAGMSIGMPLLGLPLLLASIAAVMMIGLGMGLLVCGMTVRFRDLHHLIPLFSQLLFYVTPIVYPLTQAPEKWRWLFALNPMSGVVELGRYSLLGTGHLAAGTVLLVFAEAVVLLAAGILCFERVQRSYIDTV
ncbi:lipopolysaccharide transport system permease protein [Verrucomicrobium sp. GAS474]|uniref:ABC transporter permease n=1 Tax=Verrucomicrobium sp. GAS474 TaxID=1882831 RepID=UPI00087B89C1|nr:ABC transporter permease [Verrucomicrobium sp. GAS474]SDT86182.1 lipopolysaccharide transport system permease protein [Verrucomicrobium sp. GAS474]